MLLGKPRLIVQAVLAACAAAIVSGDSHLLALGIFRTIPILTPSKCLEK